MKKVVRRWCIDAGYFGLWVSVLGRTNLSTHYTQRRRPGAAGTGGGATGTYTLRRWQTRAQVRGVNAVLRELSRGRRTYLITHTMGPQHDAHERRARFRKLVHRLRQEPEVYAYQWMTELHPGEGDNAGTIHHHLALVTRGFWRYADKLQRWSKRYCDSPNGLDIRPLPRKDIAYPCDDLHYLEKDLRNGSDAPALPFRWWGCSAIKRNALVEGPVHGVEARHPYTGAVHLRVGYRDAARYCAEATRKHILDLDARKRARRLGKIWQRPKPKYQQVWVDNWQPDMLGSRHEACREGGLWETAPLVASLVRDGGGWEP